MLKALEMSVKEYGLRFWMCPVVSDLGELASEWHMRYSCFA